MCVRVCAIVPMHVCVYICICVCVCVCVCVRVCILYASDIVQLYLMRLFLHIPMPSGILPA